MSIIFPKLKGVTKSKRGGFTVYEVETAKAAYQGMPWRSLGRFGRRKFENLMFIEAAHAKQKPHFVYL